MGVIHSKVCQDTISTFENHCLEGKVDSWRPLLRLWRGSDAAARDAKMRENAQVEKDFNLKKSGNGVCCTNALLLLVKIMLW